MNYAPLYYAVVAFADERFGYWAGTWLWWTCVRRPVAGHEPGTWAPVPALLTHERLFTLDGQHA